MVRLDPAEKDVAIGEVRRFVAEVFSGHRQLNVPFEAKSRRLKSLRKEPDKAKIILLLFFHLVRDRILLGTAGKACVFRKRKRGVRRSEHRMARSGCCVSDLEAR